MSPSTQNVVRRPRCLCCCHPRCCPGGIHLRQDVHSVRLTVDLQAKVVTVDVGATPQAPGGVFQFIPSTITAENNTIVNFKFSGMYADPPTVTNILLTQTLSIVPETTVSRSQASPTHAIPYLKVSTRAMCSKPSHSRKLPSGISPLPTTKLVCQPRFESEKKITKNNSHLVLLQGASPRPTLQVR